MVGYIFLSNRARWWEKKLNIIITTKFKEYYIYEISNLNRRCVEKLRKLIKKDNIKQVACEEDAVKVIDAGATRIGASASIAIVSGNNESKSGY